MSSKEKIENLLLSPLCTPLDTESKSRSVCSQFPDDLLVFELFSDFSQTKGEQEELVRFQRVRGG